MDVSLQSRAEQLATRDCRPGHDGRGPQRADAADDEVGLGADAQYGDGRSSGPQSVAVGGWRRVAARRAIAGGEPGQDASAEPPQRPFAEDGARRPGRADASPRRAIATARSSRN